MSDNRVERAWNSMFLSLAMFAAYFIAAAALAQAFTGGIIAGTPVKETGFDRLVLVLLAFVLAAPFAWVFFYAQMNAYWILDGDDDV